MKILNQAQTQQIAGGGVIAIQTNGKAFTISDDGISASCAQAIPSLMGNTFSWYGLTRSPCSTEEIKLFKQRYDKAVLDSFNSERTFQHKERISFPMVRR